MIINEMHESWHTPLAPFSRTLVGETALRDLHRLLRRAPATYHPVRENVFAAFEKTHFSNVRVVIIGQDPYPCRNNATGLAFSTPVGRDMAKSVAMIYCAIATNISGKIPKYGNLDHLAQQGVLLLNRSLTLHANTVQNKQARKNWRLFTQAVVQALIDSERSIHFMLWGGKAQKIKLPPDYQRSLIHRAPHPAVIEIEKFEEFRKCGHFSAVNDEIRDSGRAGEEEINWFPPLGDPNYG